MGVLRVFIAFSKEFYALATGSIHPGRSSDSGTGLGRLGARLVSAARQAASSNAGPDAKKAYLAIRPGGAAHAVTA